VRFPEADTALQLDRAELLRLYELMVLLRQFELAAQAAYKKGETPGFIHLYVGQEAVAVGICAHLRDDDWTTSTHRGHGHALAKGMEPRVLGSSNRANGARRKRVHTSHRCSLAAGLAFDTRNRAHEDRLDDAFLADGRGHFFDRSWLGLAV
jgi:2-oxoisovalerate dehydrogenase E1 component